MLTKKHSCIAISLFAIILTAAVTFCTIFAVSAQAAGNASAGNAIGVSAEMSKESYSGNEEIKLKIDLFALAENIENITISTELPDGFIYTSNSSESDQIGGIELYQSTEKYITFKYDSDLPDTTDSDTIKADTDTEPDTSSSVTEISQADTRDNVRNETASQTSDVFSGKYIAAIIIISILAVLAAVMAVKKKSKHVCTFILAIALSLPMIASGVLYSNAQSWALDGNETITITKEFTMNNKNYECKIHVTCSSEETEAQKYDIYADTVNGNDGALGTLEDPLATLGAAAEKANEYLEGTELCSVTIYLREGEYFTSGIKFDGADFGNASSKINIAAYNNESVTISSNKYISASDFTPVDGTNYYKCQLPQTDEGYPKFEDFYVNGSLAKLADADISKMIEVDVVSNCDPETAPNGLYLDKEFFDQFANQPDLSPMRMTIRIEWQCAVVNVKSVDYTDVKTVGKNTLVRVELEDDDWKQLATDYNNPKYLSILYREYSFSNSLLFLDKEGEYFYDNTTGTVYYYPISGADISTSEFAYPCSENLITFDNINNASVYGITFTGTTSNYITDNSYFAGQANNVNGAQLRHSALLFENTKNIRVDSCSFNELGTNGVMFSDRSENITVINNSFNNIGMSAVIVGNSVLYWLDATSSTNIIIANNSINGTGIKYFTSCAVYLARVNGLKIMHNDIQNTSYTAISVGWGWSALGSDPRENIININKAEIAYNRIKNYMKDLKDGGAIYVVGGNAHTEYPELFNFIHDNYVDRGNGFYGERGIYLDGSASNWRVYNNVAVNMQTPVFAQYHVAVQYIHNSTIDNNYSIVPLSSKNASAERNVIQKDNFSCISFDELKRIHPKTVDIIENSGTIK